MTRRRRVLNTFAPEDCLGFKHTLSQKYAAVFCLEVHPESAIVQGTGGGSLLFSFPFWTQVAGGTLMSIIHRGLKTPFPVQKKEGLGT